jgi:hypothetical protein
MLKRSLLIGFLCIGLIALLSTESTARCRIVNGKLTCSEVCADTFLQGVGNPESNPVAVCATLYIDKVSGQCKNKPFNATKAQGTVFFPELSVPGSTFVQVADLTDDRGSATSEICWTGAEGWDGIKDLVQSWIDETFNCIDDDYDNYCPGSGICPNPNWWFDQYNWAIEGVYVFHSSYQYDSKGNLKSTSALCRRCTLGGTECGFGCTSVNMSECQGKDLDDVCYCEVNPGDPDCQH